MIFSREIILSKRNKEGTDEHIHLISNKFFGISLDKTLIDFDRYYSKRPGKVLNFVPVFFNPSFLLKKLYKFIPVKSDDYRQAFFSAISSPVFKEDNRQVSRSIQDTLKYFQSLGIDDHAFIVRCLTNDVFLEEIKVREESEELVHQFIESEIQKDYKIAVEELTVSERKRSDLASEKQSVDSEKTELQQKKKTLETDIHNLNLSVKSLQKQLKKISNKKKDESVNLPLDLYKSERDKLSIENEGIRKKLEDQKNIRKKEYYDKKVRHWKQNALIVLSIVTISIAIFLFLIFKNKEYLLNQNNPYKDLYLIIITFISLLVEWFVIRATFMRFHDQKNIEAYRNSIELPENLN